MASARSTSRHPGTASPKRAVGDGAAAGRLRGQPDREVGGLLDDHGLCIRIQSVKINRREGWCEVGRGGLQPLRHPVHLFALATDNTWLGWATAANPAAGIRELSPAGLIDTMCLRRAARSMTSCRLPSRTRILFFLVSSLRCPLEINLRARRATSADRSDGAGGAARPRASIDDYLARALVCDRRLSTGATPVQIAANLSIETLKAVSREHRWMGGGDVTLAMSESLEELLEPATLAPFAWSTLRTTTSAGVFDAVARCQPVGVQSRRQRQSGDQS